jgi:hypothetical protein
MGAYYMRRMMRPSEPYERLDLTTFTHDRVVVFLLAVDARLGCALIIAFGETLLGFPEELG